MKKSILSTATAFAFIAVACAFFIAPAQDAEAYVTIDPKDQLYLCYGASLAVDTDDNGTYDLGWNEHAGSNLTTCNAVLSSMINTAQSNGWGFINPTCYTFTSDKACRISIRY